MTDSIGPLTAGLIISLINKYILNNPKLDTCCKSVEPEEVDSESESDDTTQTEMSAANSKRIPGPYRSHLLRTVSAQSDFQTSAQF